MRMKRRRRGSESSEADKKIEKIFNISKTLHINTLRPDFSGGGEYENRRFEVSIFFIYFGTSIDKNSRLRTTPERGRLQIKSSERTTKDGSRTI